MAPLQGAFRSCVIPAFPAILAGLACGGLSDRGHPGPNRPALVNVCLSGGALRSPLEALAFEFVSVILPGGARAVFVRHLVPLESVDYLDFLDNRAPPFEGIDRSRGNRWNRASHWASRGDTWPIIIRSEPTPLFTGAVPTASGARACCGSFSSVDDYGRRCRNPVPQSSALIVAVIVYRSCSGPVMVCSGDISRQYGGKTAWRTWLWPGMSGGGG